MSHLASRRPWCAENHDAGPSSSSTGWSAEKTSRWSRTRTPVISDRAPGPSDARAARVPVVRRGPCAAAAAAAASGLPCDSFVFLGFLPRGEGKRRKILAGAAALGKTLIVYESPYRILDLLADAEASLGPSAQAALARELTKLHEEWLTGTAAEVRAALAAKPEILGEFVACFHPEPKPEAAA